MKLKQTAGGNIKLKLSPFEMETMLQVLSYVALGLNAKSNVIMDLLESYETVIGREVEYGNIDVNSFTDINGNISHTIIV